jgi:hypothetical protein
VRPLSQARVQKAATLLEDFTGHEARKVDTVDIPAYDTFVQVGDCLGIMYETVRDGVTEQYLHEFRRKSRPKFCVSHDGRQIQLIGGAYLFKDDGINDL